METMTLKAITYKTIVVHTITYFLVGISAFFVADYSALFREPIMREFMRPNNHPMVTAGVLFQPIRGLLFGFVFYGLRNVFFTQKTSWQVIWFCLVVMGIISTFGPTPGSIEGLVYTQLPLWIQLKGLPEILIQSFLLAYVTHYWVRNPNKKYLNRSLLVLFCLILLVATAGVITQINTKL